MNPQELQRLDWTSGSGSRRAAAEVEDRRWCGCAGGLGGEDCCCKGSSVSVVTNVAVSEARVESKTSFFIETLSDEVEALGRLEKSALWTSRED